jgi:non-heme chloroperoxidase
MAHETIEEHMTTAPRSGGDVEDAARRIAVDRGPDELPRALASQRNDMEGSMAETANINGTKLAYLEDGQGQPVVFVHGGFGDYREWELQVPAFAASFRTITLSCRGAWPNRKLQADEGITLDTFVEDLAAFIKALDLAPVHLVGHSSPGGFGGLLLAYRQPELLQP